MDEGYNRGLSNSIVGFIMETSFKLTKSELAAFAEQIEDALAAHGGGILHEVVAKLEAAFRGSLQAAPAKIAAMVRRGESCEPEFVAYQLGQLSFGHAIVAQASERRACNEFADKLLSNKYQLYFKALSTRDISGVELASIVRETEETVSRKMKELRAIGAADFYKEGTKTVHFMTPAAMSLVDTKDDFELSNAVLTRIQNLPPYMQSAKNFAAASSSLSTNG